MTRELFGYRLVSILIIFLTGSQNLSSQSSDIPLFLIQEKQESYNLNKSIQFLEDTDDNLTIESFQNNSLGTSFQAYTSKEALNPSITYWVRCKIRLNPNLRMVIEDWFLHVGNADLFEFYLLDENYQVIHTELGGTLRPAKEKRIQTGNEISRTLISIPPAKDIYIYLKYSRITNHNIEFDLLLKKNDFFQSPEYINNVKRDSLFIGFIFTMILINLMFFFFSGRIGFLFHGLFISGVLILIIDFFGVTPNFWFIKDHPKLVQYIDFLALAMLDIGYFMFIKEYLNLKKENLLWNTRFIHLTKAKILFFILLTLFFYLSQNEPFSDRILAIFMTISFLFSIIYIAFIHKKKSKQKYFLLACTLFLFIAVCFNAYSIVNGQGLWTLFTEIGLSAEIFVFSIALAFGVKELVEQSYKITLQQQEKELVNERKVTQRLKHLDTLKDQFLANTSHELKTPLNGIIGITESLKDGIAGSLPRLAIENLNLISSSSIRLANLVNDILDFSKLRNLDLELQLKPMDIKSAADVVYALHQPLLKGRNLKLVNSIPNNAPLVNADENRIQQILHNFVSNAIKFSAEGSIEISCSQEDNMLSISIRDEGIGIPKNKQDIIFDTFEQYQQSTVREYGGTGLGLTIAKKLVELHGGIIRVNSSPGKGSTFTFTLPIYQFSAGEKYRKPQKPSSEPALIHSINEEDDFEEISKTISQVTKSTGEKINILVVDDEPINRKVLENHLTLKGYEVTQAFNGLQALEILNTDKEFDLVILDVMMPKISGFEVCQKLREVYHPSELPIIMLTAKNRTSNLVEGFNVGANDYLTKPFSKDELLSRISIHLNLRFIHQATSKYVPTEFLRAFGRKSITEVRLGDHSEKKVTVFFSDIRDYTSLSEKMSPEDNFKFVNAYVGRMGPIISEFEGFVHQYLGDGIMAIFPESLEHALKASISMQKKIQEYNTERIDDNKKPIRVGIGLHVGPLVMGIIGDEKRNEPATISDTVNAASRMEGLTKHYGANIIVSGDSMQSLKNKEEFHFRFLENVQVKGKNKVIGAYECIDGDKEEVRAKKIQHMSLFEGGMKLFYAKEFGEATAVFSKILKHNEEDLVARYFMNKAARYTHQGVQDDWQGIEKFDSK